MGGPGDRAPKDTNSSEPTQFSHAEGHGSDPNNVGLDRLLRPGSESSARTQSTPTREPGDLEGGLVVDGGRQAEAGRHRAASRAVRLEESGEVVAKKSAKTRVTPVESMEGRTEAEGKSASRNAPPTQGGTGALTFLEPSGSSSASTNATRSPSRRFFIHGLEYVSLTRRPEVGARCGKSARRVLSGGRPERAVPTRTVDVRRARETCTCT